MSSVGEVIVHKFQIHLELLRPFTLLAPIIVSCSVMIASLVHSGTLNIPFLSLLWTIMTASICFALLNGASNILNQATDWKEDALSKPYRPIPKGKITPREAYTTSLIIYMIALLLSLAVHLLFCFFICIITFFSVTYSLPPRMKKYLFFNQLWVALPRGFFAILASWSVFSNPFSTLPLAMGCIAALFLFGGTATKDILDAEADRTVGTKTLVNVYGVKRTAFFSLFFMLGAFGLVGPFVYLDIIDDVFLPILLLGFLSILIGWLMFHNQKNTKRENIPAWTLMYITYFIFAVSFSALTISFSA
jgi:geranylgeranylglycerol-phosphate geranylgeranyltransferase